MKTKENLLTLIKSLTKSEKRNFKLFIARDMVGESSPYIKLFDLIDKVGSVEKQDIQKFYKDDDFMEKQFRVYKYLLYRQILKSLSSYKIERSVDDQLMELIRHAKILYDKSMYPDAVKILEKAKSLACKYEKLAQLVEIISWQKKVFNTMPMYEVLEEKDIINLLKEEMEVLKKIAEANEYRKVYALIFLSYRINGVTRSQVDIDKYNSIIDIASIKDRRQFLSFHAELDFYSIYLVYYIAINKIKDAYVYAKKIVKLSEVNLRQIKDNPKLYITSLTNLLFVTYRLKQYKEFFNLASQIKLVLKQYQSVMNEKEYFRTFLFCYNLELAACVDTGQVKQGSLLIPQIEETLKESEIVNSDHVSVAMNTALLHFLNGDYHKALLQLNTILNEEKNNLDLDKYTFLKIFQLIVHFEKGNYDFLPYIIKSVYRDLMQRKKLYKVEKVLILFLRIKLNKIKTKKDELKAFKGLKEELISICKDPQEARFMEEFDVISWLESKIENRPLDDILREKSGYVL